MSLGPTGGRVLGGCNHAPTLARLPLCGEPPVWRVGAKHPPPSRAVAGAEVLDAQWQRLPGPAQRLLPQCQSAEPGSLHEAGQCLGRADYWTMVASQSSRGPKLSRWLPHKEQLWATQRAPSRAPTLRRAGPAQASVRAAIAIIPSTILSTCPCHVLPGSQDHPGDCLCEKGGVVSCPWGSTHPARCLLRQSPRGHPCHLCVDMGTTHVCSWPSIWLQTSITKPSKCWL